MAKNNKKTKKEKNKKLKKKSPQAAKRKTVVKKKTAKKIARESSKEVKAKKRIPIGGMVFNNGLMFRSPKNAALALRDEEGDIEVFTFSLKNIKRKFPIFYLPFFRGIFFILEKFFLNFKSSSFKKNLVKKILYRRPKTERLFARLSVFFLNVIYLLLFIGFLNYLHIQLNATVLGSNLYFWYNFVLSFVYISFFIILFSLLYFGRRGELELFNYHGAEHKIINSYEKFGNIDEKSLKKSEIAHPRCEIAIYFWAVVFLSLLINLLKVHEASWAMGLVISLGLIFIAFSLSYEFVRLVNRANFTYLIFIKPLYIFQYLLSHEPDSDHLAIGKIAFNELLRMEKERK